MSIFRMNVESGGRPLKGATIYIYDEDDTIADGQEEGAFTSGDLTTIYSDRDMTTETDNPQVTDTNGDIEFYVGNGTRMAVKATRTGFGSRWYRGVEALASDPV